MAIYVRQKEDGSIDKLVDVKDASYILGIAPQSLRNRMHKKIGPETDKIFIMGRPRVTFIISELHKYSIRYGYEWNYDDESGIIIKEPASKVESEVVEDAVQE